MAYHAIYERATDGDIWAYFIEIPGVAGSGETIDAARASLLESVRLARESGADIPAPQDIVKFEEVEAVA
jgi:predicted RNase H-like HicB family nuclease